jgi:phosphoenolpyruvate carboxykinase (ATP)
MVRAALAGKLDSVKTAEDPVFGLHVPQEIPEVPNEVLSPRGTWADKQAYDEQAKKLAGMFRTNFEKFEKFVSDGVKKAGPKG